MQLSMHQAFFENVGFISAIHISLGFGIKTCLSSQACFSTYSAVFALVLIFSV